MAEIKKDIHTESYVTDVGASAKIVGIKIDQTPDAITILQKQSLLHILERQGITELNTVMMPLDLNVKIEPNSNGNEGNQSNSYAQLLGELQFTANLTHPNIVFAINRLALYIANPSMQHWTAMKHVLRYLSGTRTHGITYHYSPEPISFHRYANASYKNQNDGKSISGYAFIAAGGAMTNLICHTRNLRMARDCEK
jgi:hypothetical protein